MKIFVLCGWILFFSVARAQELKLAGIENLEWGQLDVVPIFLTEKGFCLDSSERKNNNYTCHFTHRESGNKIVTSLIEETDYLNYPNEKHE